MSNRFGQFVKKPGTCLSPWLHRAAAAMLVVASTVPLSACINPAQSAGQEQTVSRLPTDAEVEQYNAQAAPEDRIICRDEVPVGSNIPRRTCRFVSDMEETSRFTRDQLRNILQ